MKIYAPVKDANGVYASVRFVNGVGETNNPALVEWFKKHHYRVEEDTKTNKTVDNSKPNDIDLDSMSAEEIRAWAKANGLGGVIKNTKDKAKLLNLLKNRG